MKKLRKNLIDNNDGSMEEEVGKDNNKDDDEIISDISEKESDEPEANPSQSK
jgi:hypothetical protein